MTLRPMATPATGRPEPLNVCRLHERVVLQTLSHLGGLGDGLDPVACQHGTVTDSAQHQQLRRAERTRA